jgi:small GTP-binding protein
MKQMKLCMVGSFAVGKTSLVKRYVQSIFSEKYHTTVGVKIDKKEVMAGGEAIRMMIWDLAGEDSFTHLRLTYMRGAAGYLLVADGTRAATLDLALDLNRQIEAALGPIPFVLVLNKEDLADTWEIDTARVERLEREGVRVFRSSAKDGRGVEAIFQHFASLQPWVLAS